MYQRFDQFYGAAVTDSKKYPCPSLPNASEFFSPPAVEMFTPSPSPLPTPSPPKTTYRGFTDSKTLLPVLDCRFNLREICKQSILLEDHLTHKEKRCKDCCVKHFLAIEGLCEEAVSLDKDGKQSKDLESLPERIRAIQKKWFENPEKNAHECAQDLREIRKRFQQDNFDVVFTKSCSSGTCKI